MPDEGRDVKLECAKKLREAGFKYLAAELEFGSLSGLAKDLGSLAVGVSVVFAIGIWLWVLV